MKNLLTGILILVFSGSILSQVNYKVEAEKLYRSNRLEEAIKSINKHISENPDDPEGLYLRANCYEDKEDYENAILDYRRSVKLDPNNPEYNSRLAQAKEANKRIQLEKIKGFEREIEIDPAAPRNYLGIARCYKSIEDWENSEIWYDKYLKLEKPSRDEVIRYSEVLAQNNHLNKGEKILREYSGLYPRDQRIWSRYGYFNLWLGKKQTAIHAFKQALVIKPYFKEAQDGLDMASNRPYVFTHIITGVSRPSTYEYPIDKYYRLLKKNPENDELRFALIDKLIEAHRYDEAKSQADYIYGGNIEDPQYAKIADTIRTLQSSYYAAILEEVNKGGANVAESKVVQAADIYESLGRRREGIAVIENYLKLKKGVFPNLRYKYALLLSYDQQYEKAEKQLIFLLMRYPDNLDFQFLRAQILVWSLRDLDIAESYLNNIVRVDPDRTDAILLLSSVHSWKKDFSKSKEYLAAAEIQDPENKNLSIVQSEYDQRLLSYSESQNYKILEEAREFVADEEFKKALKKYDEYFAAASNPSKEEYIEYADLYIKIGRVDKALEVYDKILSKNYDSDAALLKAKHMLWSGDSLKAYQEFSELHKLQPDDYEIALYYGESLHKLKRYDEARELYENLLAKAGDESRRENLKLRLSWLPQEESKGLAFGRHIGITPYYSNYSDNIDFNYTALGVRGEISVTNWLSGGISIVQGDIGSDAYKQKYNVLKGQLTLQNKSAMGFVSMGRFKLKNGKSTAITEAGFRFNIKDRSSFSFAYERNDAAALLYSPNILNENMRVKLFRFGGSHTTKSDISLSANYQKIDITDGNSGSEFVAKAGKKFQKEFSLGYQYYSLDYKFAATDTWGAPLYYSPNNFEYHSIWGRWDAYDEDDLKLTVNGRLGSDFSSDTIIREINLNMRYTIAQNIFLNGEFTLGGSYRFYSEYTYTSALISLNMGL